MFSTRFLMPECRITYYASEYAGVKATTDSNRTCQRWDRQSPHDHTQKVSDMSDYNAFPESENYCRNPKQKDSDGAWCYTTDHKERWETCSLPECREFAWKIIIQCRVCLAQFIRIRVWMLCNNFLAAAVWQKGGFISRAF